MHDRGSPDDSGDTRSGVDAPLQGTLLKTGRPARVDVLRSSTRFHSGEQILFPTNWFPGRLIGPTGLGPQPSGIYTLASSPPSLYLALTGGVHATREPRALNNSR